MRSLHGWAADAARFDEQSLVSCAGLVPVWSLAEQTGLVSLLDRVRFRSSKVRSGAVNPAGKLACVVAGMAAGADCIDELDVVRCGGMTTLFDGVYAPATMGILLREFTFGHTQQLASAARAHLVALVARTPVLAGADQRVFIDIDSLLRPVYGYAKQGASFGHTKVAGKQVLRKGLSPLATTISTLISAPVVAGIRLRAGKASSGKGAASMVTEAITAARAAGASADLLVRGDSAYGNSAVVRACRDAGARFSVVLTKNRAVNAAIATLTDSAWTPVHYPGAVTDPDTSELISDAEVAEVEFTAVATTPHPVTARLIVRRVRDRNHQDALFPVWRYHPFFTNNTEPTAQADITHRGHAIIETVFSDLIDGPLAHLPSGRFSANSAWALCAMMAHNLLRAAATLTTRRHTRARGATLRRHLINVPARLVKPQRRPVLRLPTHWPYGQPWLNLWNNVFSPRHPPPATA
ncbi:MAG: IS1380 family transposase [Pseudonocardiales bacterium]|nr:IS1380 family transposase [Pseudonocardiales bacterium]